MSAKNNSDCSTDNHSREIGEMFSTITPWYDKQNHIFSLGTDIWWRRCLCKEVVPGPTGKVLDLAAGTLDVTVALARQYPQLQIIAADISETMLKYGFDKKVHHADRGRITPLVADARHLPLQTDSVDAVTIAFGIRNIQPRADALREMLRILTPGGRACILEFAPVRTPLIGPLYHWHVSKLMPRLSRLLSGKDDVYRAMQYLAESIEAFPDPKAFRQEINDAGFAFVQHKSLTLGLANLHIAIKA